MTRAVAITERYTRSGDEHMRMLTKQDRGATFFITQVVYDVDATKRGYSGVAL